MGEAGEGQNITHQQKKMGEADLQEFRDRFSLPITDEQIKEVPFLKLAEDSPEMAYLRERRAALGGYLPARRPKSESLADPAALGLRGPAEEHRRARDLDHDGVRAHPQHAAARQADRQARRADRAGREPHLRHGGHVPPVRHLQPGRPALPAGGRQPADVLQGGQERPDPAGGHQRAGRHVVVDRGGDLLQHQRHADDPVLHLLLDVRLPARRRSRLGGRRHAGARLPDRRHGRAAPRSTARGCSTRTATATSSRRRSRTASPTTRPSPTRSR